MSKHGTDIPADILRLLGELLDGSLSAEDQLRLRAWLGESPEALEAYCEWMHLHALLALDFQNTRNLPIAPPISAKRSQLPGLELASSGPKRGRPWLAAAIFTSSASIVLVIAGVKMTNKPAGAPNAPEMLSVAKSDSSSEVSDDFDRADTDCVAVLACVANAVPSGPLPLTVGAPIRPGKFAIESGLVQLDFLSGANVVIEGPAELDLKSSKLIACHRGKLRVRVPEQAKGFSVDTPHHRAVDLGTEFGVSVAEDDHSEVHVFEGKVELYDLDKLEEKLQSSKPETLSIGAALRTTGSGVDQRIAANSEKFIDVERLLRVFSKEGESRYSAWQKQNKRWMTDPHAIVYYSFEGQKPSARVLHNQSQSDLTSLNGAIVGCHWTEGRWPGKTALEFKGVEDRVRLDVPGEFRSMTLSCWVRIDGFDRRLSSLFLTDGHDIGEAHWQFTNNGQLLLGVEAEHLQSEEYLSNSVLRPTDLGRWIHIACVYNDEAREVSHYIDGENVSRLPIVKPVTLRIGAVELGNWVPEDLKNDRIRNLNGRIDEFLLLDRSMTDVEIQEIYAAGRPNG